MGTTCPGRYLNNVGGRRTVSEFALVHSIEGDFIWSDKRRNGVPYKQIRLAGGGHGQKGMDLLDKFHLEYTIERTYPNGVRIGRVLNHKDNKKRDTTGQSWFPSSWTEKDIKRAALHIVGLKRNQDVKDGRILFGVYKGVRVGVIRTNGQIATIFPDLDQTSVLNRSRKDKQ